MLPPAGGGGRAVGAQLRRSSSTGTTYGMSERTACGAACRRVWGSCRMGVATLQLLYRHIPPRHCPPFTHTQTCARPPTHLQDAT